jgi:uncharacterized protein YndB with AHSA1/START domain
MAQATRTIVIGAPVDRVFAFFTDPSRDTSWRPGVKEMRADGPAALGSVIHQTVAGPMGRGVAADIEVTEYEPDRSYAFRAVAGPVRPVGHYAFVAQDGSTTVTFSLSCELSGLKRLFMGGQVQRSMDGEMAALDRAKAQLES